MTSLWAESYLLNSPITSQTCHAKPKLKSTGAGRFHQLLSRWPGCTPQAAWPERLLSENRDAVALQQIKERRLPMIDRGDIRQAIDRCSNIWRLHCRALVMVGSSIRLTA